jgi:hypothetical protein
MRRVPSYILFKIFDYLEELNIQCPFTPFYDSRKRKIVNHINKNWEGKEKLNRLLEWKHNNYPEESRIRVGAEPGKIVNCVKIVLEEPEDNSFSIQYIIYNDSNIDNYIFIREEDQTRYYYGLNREIEHYTYREIYGCRITYNKYNKNHKKYNIWYKFYDHVYDVYTYDFEETPDKSYSI